MKIKSDFITNSSSTNYIFIFKGDKINLYKALINNKTTIEDKVNNQLWDYSFNIWDLIRQLDMSIREDKPGEKKHWMFPNIKTLDEAFDDNIIENIIELKAEGFNSVFAIGIGDNDGEISGTKFSGAMDMAGINIETPNLIIIAENNH
jgi:hypothetical protein